MGLSIVRESNNGMYVLRLEDGTLLADTQGRVFNIPAKYGDIVKANRLMTSAANMGFIGEPVWYEGGRTTDNEHDDQMERLLDNKIPDPMQEVDIAVEREQSRRR